MKFGRKEDLRDLYETPKGHCPPASRGHAPNFGVFSQIFGWVHLGPIISSSTVHIVTIPSSFSSPVTRGCNRLGEIHKLPIGGPHGPLEVGLFLVFLVFWAFAKIRRPEVVMPTDLPPAGSCRPVVLASPRVTQPPLGRFPSIKSPLTNGPY